LIDDVVRESMAAGSGATGPVPRANRDTRSRVRASKPASSSCNSTCRLRLTACRRSRSQGYRRPPKCVYVDVGLGHLFRNVPCWPWQGTSEVDPEPDPPAQSIRRLRWRDRLRGPPL